MNKGTVWYDICLYWCSNFSMFVKHFKVSVCEQVTLQENGQLMEQLKVSRKDV